MKIKTLSLAIGAMLAISHAFAGPIHSEVVNASLTVQLPAGRAMTVLNFSQQIDVATRARLVVTKGGFSVTVRAATEILNTPQSTDLFSGQVVIAGPAVVDVIAPGQTVYFSYKLSAN